MGIDFGERKVGLALSEGILAEPYGVLTVSSLQDAVEKVGKVAEKEGIDGAVVGVSEGLSKSRAKEFGKKLRQSLQVKVKFWDETLSTKDSQRLLIQAGAGLRKRRSKDDAFAAAVMLQLYLDSHV